MHRLTNSCASALHCAAQLGIACATLTTTVINAAEIVRPCGDKSEQTQSQDPASPLVFVDVTLNSVAQPTTLAVLLDTQNKKLWLNEKDMQRMRLRVPRAFKPAIINDERFQLLSNVDGASFEFDARSQRVSISVAGSAFIEDQTVAIARPMPMPTQTGFAAYASYDAYVQRIRSSTRAGGIFDVEVASPWGVLSATQFASRDEAEGVDRRTRIRRLDTTFTTDLPNRALSVRFGDVIANGINSSSPMRLGGFQIASNFAIRPGFLTYPTPAVGGQATLPSVAEVFVNGAPIARQAVASGPFSVNNLAAISGLGEIRLVVRDVLGREQVVVTSFYGSSQLLAQGLSDYSVAVGKLRYNYGIANSDYRDLAATGYWRYGFSPSLTTSVNAEFSKLTANAGTGATFVLLGIAEANASVSLSQSKLPSAGAATSQMGHAFALGIDRTTQSYGLGARYRSASNAYRTVADAAAERDGIPVSRVAREINAYASMSLGKGGALTASFLSQTKPLTMGVQLPGIALPSFGSTRTQVYSLAYNLSLDKYGVISIGASTSSERNSLSPRNNTVFLNYFVPLGPLYSLNVSSMRAVSPIVDALGNVSLRGIHTTHLGTLQRTLPEGEGYGFHAQVGNESVSRLEGTAAMRLATLGLDISQNRGTTGVRASVSGAVSTVGGSVNASRKITDSFVVVDAGGFANVRVYLNNNLMGRTDNTGRLFIPSLRSYQTHTIAIEPTDLPMSAEVDQTRLEIVTARSSGTALSFPVRRSASAQLRLLDPLGMPIPPGAVVLLGSRTFPVAQDGEVFLQGLQAVNEIRVRIGTTGCRLQIPFAPTDHIIPHLGAFVCHIR